MNRKVVSIVLAVLLMGLVVLPGCGVSKAELDECKALVAEQTVQIQSQNATIEEQASQIEELKNELAEAPKVPKDPTYMELIEFMWADITDEEEHWGHDSYAQVFLRRAKERGVRGYAVTIWLKGYESWFFTGFETTDKGWIYILPAIDREVKLEVGKKYHVLNDFSPFGVDDTILKIIIFN